MDYRDLKYVLAIAKYQNLTKAAEVLYIGQPTLSKFLVSLEHELGTPLFRKIGRRYILTYAGERYVEKAEEILRLKEKAGSMTQDQPERLDVINRIMLLQKEVNQLKQSY